MTAKFSASADGTKVYLGNASENALELDATGKLIKPVAPYVIRNGATAQTWQDVTASRAIGTTYTNLTGQPIQVSVMIKGQVSAPSSGGIDGYCQGQKVCGVDTQASNGTTWNALVVTLSFIVPVGAAYQLLNRVSTNTVLGWKELR